MTRISDGNSKLVGIPNISLTPCKNCAADAPCKKECYAMKFFKMYPSVRKAWTENSEQLQRSRFHFFADIRDFLSKKMPRFFRWHVAGDIPDNDYLDRMVNVAKSFPEVKFLAFTKRHDILKDWPANKMPKNLSIVASMWPGWGTAPKGYQRAWMQDGTEKRVPENALECPGACHNCGACWNLKNLKRDVVFHKH
jgi:hypothetical protein